MALYRRVVQVSDRAGEWRTERPDGERIGFAGTPEECARHELAAAVADRRNAPGGTPAAMRVLVWEGHDTAAEPDAVAQWPPS
ncbi:hypothetical protein [Streptantibioticus cattleyicolor]|uniref:Uncharacterized protein n=1 Tax=Streptantibioticus cattleyicolor (strain ATCC 35852 / DSM 46488 / JCM 4925 / NBRC 14057 / NRRL 8057) TaxID=1003195 RepID=F8JNF7_STREN|nr:hypothetical protein [Streptantibioticus cattleyicolor]AEW99075.1 hypothetical protein SCATT_p08820 [Streptantibioticus cattleyicolor NRRL 8057 = DSM 46488]CCB71877.1 protein of unknown function [Streptantibioticus cattleyicolor NRRL 8057 = DSM 46488]